MAEPWTLRVALAYPASLAVPCAGLVVLAMSWPAQSAAGQGLVFVLVGLAGVLLWTLTEYVLHRWMLHGVEPFQRWHLAHHRHAGVAIRVPLLFSVLLVLAVVGLPALLSGGSAFAAPLSAGMLLGNLLQEAVHHRLHDTRPLGSWLEARRRLHGFHHFRDERRGYGTLTDFWDRVFGTLPPRA
jgi:cyclopropane-fatty-acyl-phospholipid synthase